MAESNQRQTYFWSACLFAQLDRLPLLNACSCPPSAQRTSYFGTPPRKARAIGPVGIERQRADCYDSRERQQGNQRAQCGFVLGESSGLAIWHDLLDRKRVHADQGIGKVKSLQLLVVIEICRRILAADDEVLPVLDTPENVFKFMRSRLIGLEVEKFWSLSLNRKNRVLQLHEATSGTASNSLAHPTGGFQGGHPLRSQFAHLRSQSSQWGSQP